MYGDYGDRGDRYGEEYKNNIGDENNKGEGEPTELTWKDVLGRANSDLKKKVMAKINASRINDEGKIINALHESMNKKNKLTDLIKETVEEDSKNTSGVSALKHKFPGLFKDSKVKHNAVKLYMFDTLMGDLKKDLDDEFKKYLDTDKGVVGYGIMNVGEYSDLMNWLNTDEGKSFWNMIRGTKSIHYDNNVNGGGKVKKYTKKRLKRVRSKKRKPCRKRKQSRKRIQSKKRQKQKTRRKQQKNKFKTKRK